jgi:hypothetical protein
VRAELSRALQRALLSCGCRWRVLLPWRDALAAALALYF